MVEGHDNVESEVLLGRIITEGSPETDGRDITGVDFMTYLLNRSIKGQVTLKDFDDERGAALYEFGSSRIAVYVSPTLTTTHAAIDAMHEGKSPVFDQLRFSAIISGKDQDSVDTIVREMEVGGWVNLKGVGTVCFEYSLPSHTFHPKDNEKN